MERKSLSEILRGTDREQLKKAWDETKPADEMGPVPPGEYIARIIAGEPWAARTKGTPGYRLTFKVIEGEYTGRRFWLELWLTGPALAMTKRELAKIGVRDLDQLDRPLPKGIRCSVKVALRNTDEGDEYNAVKDFKPIGIDDVSDPFAPPPADTSAPADAPPPPPDAGAPPPLDPAAPRPSLFGHGLAEGNGAYRGERR